MGDRQKYFHDHNLQNLGRWRDYFRRFLEEYFTSPLDYWQSAPKRDIDGVTLGPDDDWRNWTFELHLEPEVELRHACDIIVDGDTFRYVNSDIGLGDSGVLGYNAGKIRPSQTPPVKTEETAKRMALG